MREMSSISSLISSILKECSLRKFLVQEAFFPFKEEGKPYVLIGLGKMSYPLTKELVRPHLLEGPFVVLKERPVTEEASWKIVKGSHPYLDRQSLEAGQSLLSFLEKTSKYEDHELFLALTGGASALVEVLPEGISREFIFRLNEDLLKSGGDIEHVNQVRQEFSCLKNGGLLTFSKAKVVHNFITSDIPSGNYQRVGSSPTIYVAQDFYELKALVKELLGQKLGQEALAFLTSKKRSELIQKKEKAYKEKTVHSHLIVDYKKLVKRL